MNLKTNIIQKIQNLKTHEKKHILQIMIENGIHFDKNSNGYFFNLSNVSETTLNNINNIILIIEKNRNNINNIDTIRELKLKEYKQLIHNNLQKSIDLKLKESIHKIKLIEAYSNIQLVFSKNYIPEKPNIPLKVKKNNVNNIYYRIGVNMKLLAKKNKIHIKHDVDIYERFEENDESFCDGENEDIEVDVNNDNIEHDEIDPDLIQDIEDDIANVEVDPEDDVDDDIDVDVDYSENHGENESDTHLKKKEEDHSPYTQDVEKYMKILKSKGGFEFNEDKMFRLVYEEYI